METQDCVLGQVRPELSKLGDWSTVRSGVYWANCCCNPDWEIRLGVSVEPAKRLMGECHPVPSLSGLDPFPSPTRHFRAGLLIVPSLRD